MKTEEMFGNKFGQLLVARLAGKDRWGNALVECLCDCGNTVVVRADHLKNGHTTSCGCWRKERHAASRDKMLGERYGKGVATELAGHDRHGNALVECLCDCGNTFVTLAYDLKRGHTTSCGCWSREVTAERSTTHGLSHTVEYKARESMLRRCDDPKVRGYEYYGARGIKVCDRWRTSFEAFLMDVGPKPGKGYHLHRKSRDDDYGPDTVAWATHRQCRADRAAEKKKLKEKRI